MKHVGVIIVAFALGVIVASAGAVAWATTLPKHRNVGNVRSALGRFEKDEPVYAVWPGSTTKDAESFLVRDVHYGSVGGGAHPVEGAVLVLRRYP